MNKQNVNKYFINEKADTIILTVLYVLLPPLWITAFLGMSVYEKNFKNRATTVFNHYFLPPLAVVAVFFTVFYYKGIYPFGDKTIAWCDMTQQGVPYIMNFKSILEGDDSLFLNMANAGGMDGWTLFRGYFARPFNYLVLFVDRAAIMDFVSVLTVLKLAACSVSAMVFFRTCVKKLDPAIAGVLSLMYSFCAFGTMYYQILNWPDAMYILPLYFTGIYLLVNKHKIALFTVSLAFVMLNFAFGFMTVLATLLLLGYYFMIKSDKQTAFEFAIGSALAALLCAPAWLSFFGAYNDSARGVDLADTISGSSLFTTKNTAYPLLMSTAFIFIAVFLYKAYKKDPLGKALYFLFGMMMIPMLIEPINKMWHAGSYMGFPNRYAFILIFCGLAIAGIVLAKGSDSPLNTEVNDNNGGSKHKSVTVGICGAVLMSSICYVLYKFVFAYTSKNFKAMGKYAASLWGDATSYKHMLLMLCVFILVYVICYAIYKKGWLNKRLFALFMLSIVVCEAYVSINTYVVPATSKVNTENFRKYGDLADRIDDDDFYRVKNTGFLNAAYSISEANFPGAIGYNCMGHYSSFTSETYLYAAKAYGYSSVWMKIESFGGTKFSDALLSIKYQIGKTSSGTKNAIYSNDKYCITETEYYLPLGVYTDVNSVDIDVTKVTRMQLQERIFDAITDGKSDLFELIEPTKETSCALNYGGGKYTLTKSSNGTPYLEYTVNVKGTKTLYLDCFDQFSNSLSEKINKSFDVYVNGTKKSSSFPKDTSNGLLNLGTFTDTTVNVKLKVLKNVSARSFGVYAMDDDILKKAIDGISTAALTNEGNGVFGSYTADENGYMFISLPYNPNYKCVVNGKSVEPIKAFGGFTAVPVYKGENSISVTYTPNMFYPSIFMMLLGIAIAVTVLIILKKKKIASVSDGSKALIGEKTTDVLSTIAYIGALCCFVVIILAVYLYPMYLKLSQYF